jgi:hypothetical protein
LNKIFAGICFSFLLENLGRVQDQTSQTNGNSNRTFFTPKAPLANVEKKTLKK